MRTLPFQHNKLLPKSEIFEEQIAARMDGSESQNKQEPQQAEHEASLTRKIRRNGIHFHLSDSAADRNVESAWGISPQAAHGTVREPLGSYGSYRPAVGLNPRLQW